MGLGRRLAQTLLPPAVFSMLTRALDRLEPDQGLRLRLCLDDSLVDLPWEFLYRPDVKRGRWGGFLALDRRISLVREAPRSVRVPRPSRRRERLLFAGTPWPGHKEWGVEEEYRLLAAALQPVQDYLSTEFVNASGDNLEGALLSRCALLHYAGHTHVADGEGFLFREIRQDAPTGAMSSELLATLLARCKCRLAVFSACDSGRWEFVEPLLRMGVPAVIGHQGCPSVRGILAFYEKLYSSLAIGLSLDEAVTWARLSLLEVNEGMTAQTCEWGAFMVYMPTSEPVLMPRPSTPAVRTQQDATRRSRHQTIINVVQNIGTASGQVTGVSALP